MKNKTNILIADDHPFLIDGISSHLQKEIEEVRIWTANNGEQALKIIEEEKIDVLISDIDMPKMNGIELSEKVKNNFPKIKIVILTQFTDRQHISPLIRIRVDAILDKVEAKNDIHSALIAISESNKYYSEKIQKLVIAIVSGERPQPVNGVVPQLTRREKEFLPYIAQGQTNKEIAERFYLSHHTIDGHRKNLYLKFTVHNVAQLATKARNFGFID